MVKLYAFNGEKWIFVDYGVANKTSCYCALGYIVIHIGS